MKKILNIIVLIALLLPNITLGAYPASWIATSTTQGWISPNKINGVEQSIVGKSFVATTSGVTSTFAGSAKIAGYLSVGSTSPLTRTSNNIQEVWCNQDYYCSLEVGNLNGGSTASADVIMNNSITTETSNFSDFGLNSSSYSDTTYSGFNQPNAAYWFTPILGSSASIYVGSSSPNTFFSIGTGCLLISCERFRITSTGNVGIGTTTPAQKLDVAGNIAFGSRTDGYGRIFLNQKTPRALPTTVMVGADDGVTNEINFGGGTVTGYIAKNIKFHTASNDTTSGNNVQMSINGSGVVTLAQNLIAQGSGNNTFAGNVGIGTSTPTGKLHVNGSTFIEQNNANGTGGPLTFVNYAGTASSNQQSNIYQGGSSSSGIWGAGTNNHLVIESSNSGTTSGGGIVLSAYNNNGIRFQTGTRVNRMIIDNSGLVGIGTTSPTSILTVAGTGTGYVNIGQFSGDTTYGSISLSGALSAAEYNFSAGHLGQSDQNDLYVSRKTGGDIHFKMANGTDQVSIKPNGSVGIGATSPGAQLQISTSTAPTTFGSPYIRIGRAEFAGTTDKFTVGYGYSSGTAAVPPVEIGAQTNSGSGNTKADIVFAARDTTVSTDPAVERVRILSGGNVGISTTTPGVKLVSVGTNALPTQGAGVVPNGSILVAGSGSNVQMSMGINGTMNGGWIQSHTASSGNTGEVLALNPNAGNVGVGTTTPLAKLDVVGTNNLSAPLFQLSSVSSFATTSRVYVTNGGLVGIGTTTPKSPLTIAANLSGSYGAASIWAASGNATDPLMTWWGDTNPETLRATILRNGNFGLGTSTPQTRLHVTNGANATTTVTIGELGLSTSKGCVNMMTSAGTQASFYINSAGTIVSELNACK